MEEKTAAECQATIDDKDWLEDCDSMNDAYRAGVSDGLALGQALAREASASA